MSNIKKIIGVVLALVMALSVTTVAFAAGNEAYTVAFSVVDNKTTINPGESATVEVRVTANYNVSAMSIPVFFDNKKVTVTATAAESLTGATIINEKSAGAETYFANSGHTKDDYGLSALVYIASFGADITSYDNALVMTLTVTANENASGAVVLECLETTIKTADNPSGTLYVLKNENPDSTQVDSMGVVVDAATITNATATINIAGAAADPEIVAIAGGTGVVDTANHYLYGIELGTTDITTVFTATNNGTLRMADGFTVIGTGTVIELLSSDGAVVDRYTVVIFGDVDGDGVLSGTDAQRVSQYVFGDHTKLPTDAHVLAADVDGDTVISGTDAQRIKQYVFGDHTKVSQY